MGDFHFSPKEQNTRKEESMMSKFENFVDTLEQGNELYIQVMIIFVMNVKIIIIGINIITFVN